MAVAPIVDTGAKIVLKGLEIFSEERRRHLSKEYMEILQAVEDAEAKIHPDYIATDVVQARKRRTAFEIAYYTEFSTRIDTLKSSGGTSGIGGVLS